MSGRLWLGLFVALSVIIGTQAQVPQDGERVRFLVISDTHVEPFEPLDDFIANLKTRDFDYILLSGDLNNLKVPEQADNQTAVIACEENIRITFNKLGHAFGFDKTIFWVPGNARTFSFTPFFFFFFFSHQKTLFVMVIVCSMIHRRCFPTEETRLSR